MDEVHEEHALKSAEFIAPLQPVGDVKEAWEGAKKRTRCHCPRCKAGLWRTNRNQKRGFPSTCFSAAMICASVYLLCNMAPPFPESEIIRACVRFWEYVRTTNKQLSWR